MNKQEALEALLIKMREWEAEGAEVPARNDRWVLATLRDSLRVLDTSPSGEHARQYKDVLVVVGAAALYLLRDEVEVVVPELAPVHVAMNPASYTPVPTSLSGYSTIAREARRA